MVGVGELRIGKVQNGGTKRHMLTSISRSLARFSSLISEYLTDDLDSGISSLIGLEYMCCSSDLEL